MMDDPEDDVRFPLSEAFAMIGPWAEKHGLFESQLWYAGPKILNGGQFIGWAFEGRTPDGTIVRTAVRRPLPKD